LISGRVLGSSTSLFLTAETWRFLPYALVFAGFEADWREGKGSEEEEDRDRKKMGVRAGARREGRDEAGRLDRRVRASIFSVGYVSAFKWFKETRVRGAGDADCNERWCGEMVVAWD
jgi:hypothetical protein